MFLLDDSLFSLTICLTIGSYGLVSVKTDPNGHQTTYAYDPNGYLNSVTTQLGHQTQWTYDALGFATSRIDAMGRTTNYAPDAWERLVTTSYPDSTTNTYGYDPNGNLTAFANYTGSWTRSYDAAGQKGLLSTTTDVDGRVLTYAYTARNELASVAETAGTTTYAYDANGNQIHLYNPTGLRTDQYYNNDNTLDSLYNWDGGSNIWQSYSYGYNADHQMTAASEGQSANVHGTPNPTQTAFGYDGQGHLSSETRTGASAPFTKS